MNQWGSIVPYFVMAVITNTMHVALTSLVLKYKVEKNSLSQAKLVRFILIETKNINPAAIFALGS